jgi:hypothetical protein
MHCSVCAQAQKLIAVTQCLHTLARTYHTLSVYCILYNTALRARYDAQWKQQVGMTTAGSFMSGGVLGYVIGLGMGAFKVNLNN